MQLCWRIYQTRIFRESTKLTSKFLERNMLHEKKYSLIADPRELIKIMTERTLFHSFRASRLLLWSLN